MGLLRLAVLGSPEVLHDGRRLTFALRKALALLLYLAVEGGMHPRSKLAAFLWPDSEPHDARTALRNAIALLRSLLADSVASPSQHTHLLSEHELLGLDPHAPLELDLDVVQQAWKQTQDLSMSASEQQRTSLVTHVQHALSLVRGPFLDGFWLGEEAPFDEWAQQQQRQWQVRLQVLFDRLSSWQEVAGEQEQAIAILVRWLALDPLQEEAYRRLMRLQMARGSPRAALQVYETCRVRLAEELQVEPTPEIVNLAEHIRAAEARSTRLPTHAPTVAAEIRPPPVLVAPLVGRAAAFTQLAGLYQQARQGQPQAVLVVGEAGIGKTRLAREFVAWAHSQGADVLSGQAFEAGGRLPYQPLVEALRPRLEEENAPEDLLADLWLAELASLLPELRVRYPDLPPPTQDELAAKLRLFEAVARLLDALAQRAPLVLLLDDLHWMDGASLDLLRYLARSWIRHGSQVLLLGTVRREGLAPKSQLSAQLADLGRDLPLTQVPLHTLSQAETLQLVQALVGEGAQRTRGGDEQRAHGPTRPATTGPEVSPAQPPLVALGQWLFTHTGGQPLYLLETLKLLREWQWLVPQLGADGTWRLELVMDIVAALAQERSRRELVPPSVRALILARLALLSPPARQLVLASAVLGTQASAKLLWQVAELGVQDGVEALEEVIASNILREEQAAVGRPASYRFAHDLVRDVVSSELGQARRQVLHQRTLALLQAEGAPAAELAAHASASGQTAAASRYSIQAGDEALAVLAVDDAIGHYEHARAVLQEHQPLQTALAAWEVEHLYVHLGQAYSLHNAWQQAQQAYEELFAYAQHQQLPTLASMTLNRLAILAAQQSHDKSQVRALLEHAWQMAETSHEQRALAETQWNLAQLTVEVWEDPTSALPPAEQALALARASRDPELQARSLSSLGLIYLLRGDVQQAMQCVEAALALYAAQHQASAARELSLAHVLSGASLTASLTLRVAEAWCWGLLACAQVHAGQVHNSIRSARITLALAHESKNAWAHIHSTLSLAQGLLEAGTYEEAYELMHHLMEPARSLPQTILFYRFLTTLGRVHHALQQWEEAQAALEEAAAMAERLGLGPARVPGLSQLCMHFALAGQWEAAYSYAVQAIPLRKSHDAILLMGDFSQQYETEALLRAGEERQARAAVHLLGERVGPSLRLRIPYLRSLAVLAAWEGHSEQAGEHLHEAAQLAADCGLPAERWQIQAALGSLCEAEGRPEQAHSAFGEAARLIQELAEGIGDEARRARFLTAPQIHHVLEQARRLTDPVPQDHA